ASAGPISWRRPCPLCRCRRQCRRCWRHGSTACRLPRSTCCKRLPAAALRVRGGGLQATAELPEAAVHDGLRQLQAAEFLYETHLVPEHAYTFKHALTHEVAYGSLPQERRRVLHAPIGEGGE